ncbi:MAG: radical SAM family heme chaperone HemW [Verrucomicrobia bacterium]|nr:radical SAM family heme chaperone HemW [Verrucomicrobiota bacterium]
MVISLYFHIPFCTKKCPYCHFYVIPNTKSHHPLLAEGLEREWELRWPQIENKQIASIYFGGGTPTLFGPAEIGAVLQRIPFSSTTEITIEANPEEATEELLSQYRSIGINRLSLGVQSLDDRSLQTLERIHSAHRARDAIFAAKAAGFDNISIDLMYDLPGQTEASWHYTLDQLSSLPISHLSLYNLTFEPHTSFYKKRETLLLQVPPPETSLKLLQSAVDKLESIGLKRYEISAFGRPSVHNSGYWTGRPFLGFGPSAFSYWEGKRFSNVSNLHRYSKQLQSNQLPVHFEEALPYPANIRERLAVQLRLREGVDTTSWNLPPETLATLDSLSKNGLLEKDTDRWRLSEKGMLFYDTVATEII